MDSSPKQLCMIFLSYAFLNLYSTNFFLVLIIFSQLEIHFRHSICIYLSCMIYSQTHITVSNWPKTSLFRSIAPVRKKRSMRPPRHIPATSGLALEPIGGYVPPGLAGVQMRRHALLAACSRIWTWYEFHYIRVRFPPRRLAQNS